MPRSDWPLKTVSTVTLALAAEAANISLPGSLKAAMEVAREAPEAAALVGILERWKPM